MNSYSPTTTEKLATMLSELSTDELLALVPDTKHKSAEGRKMLAEELKRKLSPNRKP